MDERILRIVLASNPWMESGIRPSEAASRFLPDRYIHRHLWNRVQTRWAEPDKAHLLVGPRQAGKTTLFWKHVIDRDCRVLCLNMEDARIRNWCSSPYVFLEDVRSEFPSAQALFLDEVQHLEEAALFVKGIVDQKPGFPVLVTGSSSYHLKSRTRESLAGRATRATLLPFSFSEVVEAFVPAGSDARSIKERALFGRHVRFGGYPRAWAVETPEEILFDLAEAFLLRDASDFSAVRRPDAFQRLVGLLARQSGSLVNLSEWAAICGISRNTVQEYCQLLEDAHLVRLLPVFAGGRRAELTATPKAFFLDTGIRNAVLCDFNAAENRGDCGALLENWVFSELTKTFLRPDLLHYWRTRSGAEVDFVVSTGGGLVGFEVKATAMRQPRISRGSRSFIQAYQPSQFFIVNQTLYHVSEVEKTPVRWVRFEELARECRALAGPSV